MSSALEHARADAACASGLHAFDKGFCRDCGTAAPRNEPGTSVDPARLQTPAATNTVRKLLVQFECSPDTRWLYPVDDLCHDLACLARLTANAHTAGSIPAVTVTVEN